MRRRLLVALFATLIGTVLWTPVASAAPVTKTLSFPLTGSSNKDIFNESFSCCSIDIDDPFSFHKDIHGGVFLNMATDLNGPTHNDLNYDDANLRQGRTLDLTNTFTSDSGNLKVTYTAGFTLNLYDFLDFHPTISESDTLPCQLPLLTESCSHTKNIPLAHFEPIDLRVLGLGPYLQVNVFMPITTSANLLGDGVSSDRTIQTQDSDLVDPATLQFTSSPQVVDETNKLACTTPAGDQIKYSMGDEASHVTGNVAENVGIGANAQIRAGVPVLDPLPDIEDVLITQLAEISFPLINLPSVSLNPINLSAPAQSVDLGELQKNNIPPKINMITSGGTMVEGKDVTWTAALSSPCGADSLHTVWRFSNPNSIREMVAYGPTAHIVFPDNGVYEATVTTTDPTGLSATKDLGSFTINNAPPDVDPVDKRAEWGDVIKYHVDAFDATADQDSLAFEWTFGDGSHANGQDVEHAFALPNAAPGYTGSVKATDKDGGVGTAGFHTIIDKRAATLVYTGAISGLTKTSPILSATLADDHGQPVNGGFVNYSLGGQSASSVVDSTGHTSTPLLLAQAGDVNYPFAASYGGNLLYLSSSAALPATFRVNKRATSVAYLGDLDQRPNHVALLSARVTDELGQPVPGAAVLFTLGAQSISAVTDSTGLASAGLALNQGPGAYALRAIYAGDSNYLPGSAGAMTFSIPRNSGAAAGAGVAAANRLGAARAGRAAATHVGIRRARKAGRAVARHHTRAARRRGN
jgi:hypothetical protein